MSERAFTAHAAHALRTPVAGIDVQLALAIKEAPEAIRPRLVRAREAAGRLGRVMQALLTMFRSGIEPQRQDVDLRQLIDALAFHDMAITIHQHTRLVADPDLLAAAFPEVYRQLALFYRQDSLARLRRLQAEHPDYRAVENATNG